MGNKVPMLVSTLLSTVGLTTSATVGVDKTFSPEGVIAPGVQRYVDRSGGIALGFPWFTFGVRPPTKTSRVYRMSMKMGVPHLETVTASTASGIVPVAPIGYQDQFIGEFLFSDRGTSAERLAFLSMVRSVMLATITASDAAPSDLTASPLIAAVTNFEPVY
jgi:hypothetical protein